MAGTQMHRLLTVAEVAKRMAVSARTVYRMVERGQLPVVVLPAGGLRFDPDDIEAWISSLKVNQTSAAAQP